MSKAQVNVELSPDQAEALAQFCKRVSFSDLKAFPGVEAYDMLDAVDKLRAALARRLQSALKTGRNNQSWRSMNTSRLSYRKAESTCLPTT